MLLHRHRAINWYAFGVDRLNSRGVWLFQSLVCFRTVIQFFCAVCIQAMTHSAAYVPSQQAVELVVVGAGFIDATLVLILWGDQWQRKVE